MYQLLYNGPLLCSFNVSIKGLKRRICNAQHLSEAQAYCGRLYNTSQLVQYWYSTWRCVLRPVWPPPVRQTVPPPRRLEFSPAKSWRSRRLCVVVLLLVRAALPPALACQSTPSFCFRRRAALPFLRRRTSSPRWAPSVAAPPPPAAPVSTSPPPPPGIPASAAVTPLDHRRLLPLPGSAARWRRPEQPDHRHLPCAAAVALS